jgi:hypothetical protein
MTKLFSCCTALVTVLGLSLPLQGSEPVSRATTAELPAALLAVGGNSTNALSSEQAQAIRGEGGQHGGWNNGHKHHHHKHKHHHHHGHHHGHRCK